MRGLLKSISTIFLSVVFVFCSQTSVFAELKFPTNREYEFAENNILFYDPEGGLDTTPNCDNGPVSGDKITLIGDSLSVGAASEFDTKFPGIDHADKTYNGITYTMIQVSKSFSRDSSTNFAGTTVAQALVDNHELRPYLIYALGTNDAGAVDASKISSLIDIVGDTTKVVLVTNASDGASGAPNYTSNNEAIRKAAEDYSNVSVADWAEVVGNNENGYIDDATYHVHLNADGNKAYVDTISKALGASNSGSGGSGGGTGTNQNYAGAQVFSDAEMALIEELQPFYKEAADEYNFPWQILAVIHSNENSNQKSNPANGQGAYQLYSYTAGGTNSNAFKPTGPISDEEFLRQSKIAASIVAGYGLDLNIEDNVKKMFFMYNGTADKYVQKAIAMGFTEEQARNGEGSAYVMNRYDEQRDPTSPNMSSYWPGRFTGDGHYDPTSTSNGFGTFVKYQALGGVSGPCGGGNGNIVDTAILLSWEGRGTHSKDDPKPEYVKAMQEVGTYIDPCRADGTCAPKGASCDQFVSTVMRYSGADKDFPVFSGGDQVGHMERSDKYEEVQHNNDLANLKPGDIFVTNNAGYHIYLYIGEIDGQHSQASASFNGRTGEHYSGVYFSESGGRIYRVFRYKG